MCKLQVKADKIVANAKEEAAKTKAFASEQCEKGIADSHTQAERVRTNICLVYTSFLLSFLVAVIPVKS